MPHANDWANEITILHRTHKISINPFSTNFLFCNTCNLNQLIVQKTIYHKQVANMPDMTHSTVNHFTSSAPYQDVLVGQTTYHNVTIYS